MKDVSREIKINTKSEEKLEKKCNDSPNRYSYLREKKIL
jgi:hypothetical protein